MDNDKVFVQELNKYLDGDKECNGIIVPNKFDIKYNEYDKLIFNFINKHDVFNDDLLKDYDIINNYVWSILSNTREYICYTVVDYIAKTIKYNSNIITITLEKIKSFVETEISDKDFYDAINYLKNNNVIGDCNIDDCYIVNPIAIYKGNIYKFIYLCVNDGMLAAVTDDDGKLIVDRALILKDKFGESTEVIVNTTYYDKFNIASDKE